MISASEVTTLQRYTNLFIIIIIIMMHSTVVAVINRLDHTIKLPWQNFLNPQFIVKFQRELSLFLEVPEFP